jgi:hypothetical protein
MAEASLEVALQRLSRLENQLSWWKRGTAAIGIGVLVLTGMFVGLLFKSDLVGRIATPAPAIATSAATELRAERFIVTDEQGNPRAGFGMLYDSGEAHPALILEDRDGRERASLSFSNDGSYFKMLDKDGKDLVFLAANSTKTTDPVLKTISGIGLNFDAGHGSHFGLFVKPDGDSSLRLSANNSSISILTKSEGIRDREPYDTYTSPQVSLLGGGASASIRPDELTAARAGSVVVLHTDAIELKTKGNRRAVLGSVDLETVRTGATERTPPSSLTLFDKDGKVIRAIP